MPSVSEQVEWLSLVDISGPFLVPAVLEQVFPQGLEKVQTPRRQRIRSAYEEWRDAVDDDDPQLGEMHSAWVLMVLQDMLEYEDTVLSPRQSLDRECMYRAPEHGAEYSPDYAIRGEDGKSRLLISIWPPGTDLEKAVPGDSWAASPLERMTLLCRAIDTRLGLVTDGERWMLVNAPVGATSGYAGWLARLWWQEPVTLKAFQSLLGVRRCFGPQEETLDALLEKSVEFQEEVTDTLGEQVRRAVEILVQSLGRADQDRNGELLKDGRPAELYEAGLTIMMRMVFTLCAEERGLLLLGDPTYDQYYAVSTLRARLREDADLFGVEVLERRHDAWSRMLAVFRAIYGGIEHESLRMPALGGSLFDPDRFPMLEGRAKGTTWRDTLSVPLPIDNRTVLLLLEALQVLEQKGGAQLLSYRALDVEQIGHVYEGLLEYTVAKLDKVTVGLVGSQKVRDPSVALAALETLKSEGQQRAVEHLVELTGRSAAAIGKALARGGDEAALLRLVHACGGDEKLAHRLLPFADLIRADSWGTALVYKPGSFAVVRGSHRRETGTHYTPKSLTESIVEKTLEPAVYAGPSEGGPRESWKLRTPAELLDLKVCDPAMGSGAFLVQVCRYLSEKLVEAWAQKETEGKAITADGFVLDALGRADPMPKSLDVRLIVARRLIAERCLYGVDINPLAVELAKLSIWLVTMAKGRPFGFLDHNLRSGDSLLGIHRLDQLTKLTMNPDEPGHQPRLFGQNIRKVVEEAVAIRAKLRAIPIRDIRDVEMMARLDSEARKKLAAVELLADAMIGIALARSGLPNSTSSALESLAAEAGEFLDGNAEVGAHIDQEAKANLSFEVPSKTRRRPIHWPIEFPEVFGRGDIGFDAVVGNPPFMFGKNITVNFGGQYNGYLIELNSRANKNVDLCAHFFVRAFSLIAENRCFSMLATSSISEGVTARASLGTIIDLGGVIYDARTKIKWPGKAAVYVATVAVFRGSWCGDKTLDARSVSRISPLLTEEDDWEIGPLAVNEGKAFVGVIPNGSGFFLGEDEYDSLLKKDPRNRDVLRPYITGEDLNAAGDQPKRFIINFWDWPLSRAKQYGDVLRIVEERVMPHRQTLSVSKKKAKDNWWLYEASAKDLLHATGQSGSLIKKPKGPAGSLAQAIAIARISKTGAFVFVPTQAVYAAEVVVVASADYGLFAILQSSVHIVFAWNRAGKMKTDLRYSPTLCFTPFPFPFIGNELRAVGEEIYLTRHHVGKERGIGLTDLCSLIHDPDCKEPEIVRLREMAGLLDSHVLAAYGWPDINTDFGFHEVAYLPESDRVRFSISEEARVEILRRLTALNRHLCERSASTPGRGNLNAE